MVYFISTATQNETLMHETVRVKIDQTPQSIEFDSVVLDRPLYCKVGRLKNARKSLPVFYNVLQGCRK